MPVEAICALSPSSDHCFIAYPAHPTTGEVLIFDAIQLRTVNMLQGHKSAITHLSFNADGTLLATASDTVRFTTELHSDYFILSFYCVCM